MWGRKKRVWQKFNGHIMAADSYNAILLSSYLREIALLRLHIHHLEVIDLQKYKVVRLARKVQAAIYKSEETPFVFVVGKN